MMIAQKRHISISCQDGFTIGATVFEPANLIELQRSGSLVAVVIGSATGVLQEYYHPMAEYLATVDQETNVSCVALCFDFRGTGRSKPDVMRHFDANIRHQWARQDFAAVVQYLQQEYSPREICLLGNSVGVHVVALTTPEISGKVAKVMAISANNAYIGFWRRDLMSAFTFFAFYVVRRILCKLYGYYPASKIFGSAMVDLPTGVANDWAKWMLNRNYCTDEPESKEALESFRGDMLSYAFNDDAFATLKSFDTMFRLFEPHLRRGQLRYMNPKDLGLPSVGHVGFFRRSVNAKTDLWNECKRFLVNGTMPDPPEPSSSLIRSKM